MIELTSDQLLEGLIRGLLDPAQRLSLIAHGDGDAIGPWRAITDPAVAPLWGLPFSAQWVGAVMPQRLPGETDDAYTARARLELLHPRGRRRGSPRSLELIVKAYLVGDQTVTIEQYLGGNAFRVGVGVFEASVTDIAALIAAVNDPRVSIAGMQTTVDFIGDTVNWDIAQFESTFYGRKIADFEAAFASISEFEDFTVTT